MQIIPAVNVSDFSKAQKQVKKILEFLSPDNGLLHIDVVDGKFAPNVTWGDPAEFAEWKFPAEIHLMVVSPEKNIESWLKTKFAKRIIVHAEAMENTEIILKKCGEYGAEAMLAINPDTEVGKLTPYFGVFNSFQILAVPPGLAGQPFDEEVINKIRFLRERQPDAKIEVDGGIDLRTAKLAKDAGADIAVSASYILKSGNPAKAYQELQNI